MIELPDVSKENYSLRWSVPNHLLHPSETRVRQLASDTAYDMRYLIGVS